MAVRAEEKDARREEEAARHSGQRSQVPTEHRRPWNDYAKTYLGELCRSEAVRKELRLKVAAATKAEKIGLARILAAEGTAEDKEVVDALAHDRDPAVAQEGIKAARTLGARLP